jgi:hypothetical protein
MLTNFAIIVFNSQRMSATYQLFFIVGAVTASIANAWILRGMARVADYAEEVVERQLNRPHVLRASSRIFGDPLAYVTHVKDLKLGIQLAGHRISSASVASFLVGLVIALAFILLQRYVIY